MFGLNGNTKLLLHFDGADGATSTVDATGRHSTINFRGDAQLDTAQKKFGTSSLLLDGTGDYIDLPDSDDWDILGGAVTDEWTVDFLFRFPVAPSGLNIWYFLSQYVDEDNFWYIRYYHDSTHPEYSVITFHGHIPAVYFPGVIGNVHIDDTDWHHLVLVKVKRYSGGNWCFDTALYLDGTWLGDSSLNDANNLGTVASSLYVGRSPHDISDDFSGNIDELRFHASNYFNAIPNTEGSIIVPTSAYSRFRNNYGMIVS